MRWKSVKATGPSIRAVGLADPDPRSFTTVPRAAVLAPAFTLV
jgi:hypothetical protein